MVFTEGNTSAIIESKYEFKSKNVSYNILRQEIVSKEKSNLIDNNGNSYEFDNFYYEIDNRVLKSKNVNVYSKVDNENTDKYFFSEGIFNFSENEFLAKETKIKIHKNIFEDDEQDPRIYGVSSRGDKNQTIIKKGVFTSCKIRDNCPPWSITAEKITHDKNKKDLIYKNAILKLYDLPIVYFPKFFHPDPTVERRTGFLKPQFNNSKKLGSSLFVPYFITLGEDKDYTFKPTIFDDNKIIFQNEYRKVTKDSSLVADFSLTTGHKSTFENKKKNINHLFLNFKKDLNYSEFNSSKLEANLQRVNNDTYLKVFQNNLYSFESDVLPNDKDTMVSNINFLFDHEDYDFSSNFQIFEELGKKNSDRYQYILPSYTFSKMLDIDNFDGIINFNSTGSNNLKSTNNLRTSITNDLSFNSKSYYLDYGFKNSYNLYFKNLNVVGKNDPTYKSSPSIEGMSIAEINTSFPMIKASENKNETFTPKLSFRINPGNNMEDLSSSNRSINANNIFEINRLGISDSFEAGKSITLGCDYKLDALEKSEEKKYELENENKFIEFKLATVFRDKVENKIPNTSTLNNKSSNLYGAVNNRLSEDLSFNYNFSIDNNLETFEQHSLSSELTINNFVTKFEYLEENGQIGSNHSIENTTSYNLDSNNMLSFSTRRNKKINLTEYYNLSYEYKNDCLTAGVKFNKTFYKDADLTPEENLFFTVTFIPLTTYERTIYQTTN